MCMEAVKLTVGVTTRYDKPLGNLPKESEIRRCSGIVLAPKHPHLVILTNLLRFFEGVGILGLFMETFPIWKR